MKKNKIETKLFSVQKNFREFNLNSKIKKGWKFTDNFIPKNINVDKNFIDKASYKDEIFQNTILGEANIKGNDFQNMEVHGEENRKKIENTKIWPHSVNCKLNIKFPFEHYSIGTGIIIGKRHILTAGHNLFDILEGVNKKFPVWALSITADPGFNGNEKPFERTCNVIKCNTFSNWCNYKDSSSDIGIMILDYDIGLETGYIGIASTEYEENLENKNIYISGYPYDKKRDLDGKYLYTCSDVISSINENKLFYYIDTNKGQSGSGVCCFCPELNELKVVGIHTDGGNDINFGVRITNSILENLTYF